MGRFCRKLSPVRKVQPRSWGSPKTTTGSDEEDHQFPGWVRIHAGRRRSRTGDGSGGGRVGGATAAVDGRASRGERTGSAVDPGGARWSTAGGGASTVHPAMAANRRERAEIEV